MISEIVDPSAVFDAEAVSSLIGHPDDRAFALVFVTRYRRLLPERLRRIAVALAAGESDDAMDAVLSLKVASATAGARELSHLAARLEVLVRADDLCGAARVESLLADAAGRADAALGAFLA